MVSAHPLKDQEPVMYNCFIVIIAHSSGILCMTLVLIMPKYSPGLIQFFQVFHILLCQIDLYGALDTPNCSLRVKTAI